MDIDQFLHREPISDRGISVVIATSNDGGTIEAAISSVTQFLDRMGRGHEIVVVDDGSTDATVKIATQLAASNRRIRVVQHDTPLGHGAALRAGFAAANYPLVLQLDGGGQFDAADIERLLGAIDQVDVVCGYREAAAGNPRNHLASVLYRWLLRWVFAVQVRDVDCGFRLFRRAALRRIPIQSNGRFAVAEILAKATFMNMLVGEVPVNFRPRTTGGFPAEPRGQTLRDAVVVFRRPQFTPAESGTKSSPHTPQAA